MEAPRADAGRELAAARALPPARGFWAGVRYPWRGARFVYLEHRELARLWLPPIAITFVLLIAAGWLALTLREPVMDWLWTAPTGSDWLAGAARVARSVLTWIVAIVLFGVGAVAVALSSSVIAAPFNDALSEAVESAYLAREPAPFAWSRIARDLVRTVGLELLKLLLYAAIMLPLLAVALLAPGVGPIVQGAVGFAFTAFFFALDYVDWAASRRELSARQRLRWAFAHLRAMLGLGAGIWLLLFVPVVNLVFMPAAVAGGTLMFLDLSATLPGPSQGPGPARS